MIRRIDLRGADRASVDYRAAVPRAEFDVEAATHLVAPVLHAVKTRGVEAILEYSAEFDRIEIDDIAVPREAMTRALEELDPQVRAALEESIRRLRATCEAELEHDVVTRLGEGAVVTHRKVPIDRVGLYVPGGLAPAGEQRRHERRPGPGRGRAQHRAEQPAAEEHRRPARAHDHGRLRAARRARALLRRRRPGDRACSPTGPGRAGRSTSSPDRARSTSSPPSGSCGGTVAIDSEAGPTEIAILADDSADAAYVAADLISQAEHDPLAASVLVTDSEALADDVVAELDKQVFATRHTGRIQQALTGPQSGIVMVDDMEQGLEVVNAYAAEHLEIQTRDASAHAARITNAGAVFVGPYAPVSLGDYCAGSNHVLPTAGCACHSSGLSVRAFLKSMHVVDYSREALAEVAGHVVTLAEAEDLPGHGAAVSVRFEQ